MSTIPLTKLKKKHRVKVVEVNAGKQATSRLKSLGIWPGIYLTVISTFALRGPVAVKIGHTTIALGYGMAQKVMVEAPRLSKS